jgi:hypothetical protein
MVDWVIVVFGLLVSASAGGAAATTAATTDLVAAAEAVGYAGKDGDYNHGADNDTDDDGPPEMN